MIAVSPSATDSRITGPVQNGPAGSPFDLGDHDRYRRWRDEKLQAAAAFAGAGFISLEDPARLSPQERDSILAACAQSSMAFYEVPALAGEEDATRRAIAGLARGLGLRNFEEHRSATEDGIVPIEVADMGGRAGFIPYSTHAINWHTDGYYSYRSPTRMIRSMILHCVRDAAEGGENGFLDPDIVYIRLRDADPAFIAALMHPHAMTIPSFDDAAGEGHGAVSGPVFVAIDSALSMRFTIRKRNVIWRDDPVLTAAREKLADVLANDPMILRKRLAPNQGIICNNVLHERRAFTDKTDEGTGRLLYRVRSYDRLGTTA